ncbi:MAG: VWA domain-containing protein [Sulfuricurvum sp.]|uniref:VWA domain-containing protein n=1 Tax=Sulfuricurvum sp. TaxID=2025608 RepID=UPI00261D63A0|nr:VWA domain-containing protein [Sulfuricurvum sp.]MDD2784877.1 VWA domain-containing protein [Sulfuricurvum sp.]
MSFASPFVLSFLLIIPLLIVVARLVRHQKIFFEPTVKERLSSHKGTSCRSYSQSLFFVTLACMIIALARPQLLKDNAHENEVVKVGIVAISLDISQSMLATDTFPNRLSFAKQSIETMMNQLSDFKIALSAFSNDAFLVAPFSEDTNSLQFLLKHLDQHSMSSQGSSIVAAIMSSEKLFRPFKQEQKDLIIVSDGGDGEDLESAIVKAREFRIRVHLYLVGSAKGSTIKQDSGELLKDSKGNIVISKRYDGLQKLSLETGGAYVSTNGDSADIVWLCEQIRLKVHKSDVAKKKNNNVQELFYYPLILALLTLFLALHPLHVKKFSWMVFVLLPWQPLHSGILDFWQIDKAHKAYKAQDFAEATKYFNVLDKEKKSAQTAYNLANALYQQKEYEKALELYQGIQTEDVALNYSRWHNIGNTLAQMHRSDEAINAYEKALSIREDEDTRYNLEFLKEQKQNQQENKKEETKPEEDTKSEPKPPQKEEKKSQSNKPKKAEEKKMSEQEAHKWERMLNTTAPKTKPMTLYKGEKHEADNAIRW